MPVPYKVRFDDDGSKCPRNIIELREKPECGVIFREEQPFKPDNRFPLPKGKIPIKGIGKIPKKIDIPEGIMPPTTAPKRLDKRQLAFTEETLPQDENEVFMSRRLTSSNYERIPDIELPPIRENIPEIARTFTHQDADRVIQSLDDIMPVMARDMLVDALEEPPLEQPRPIVRQSRIRILPDPRETEFTEEVKPRDMTDTELIEEQIQQLKRSMPPDTHKEISSKKKGKMKMKETELITPTPESEELFILKEADKFIKTSKRQLTENEVNKIVKEGLSRGISPDRTIEILTAFEDFDPAFEKSIRGMDTKEKALMRSMKQTLYEARLQSIETNLRPVVERQQSIELREDTPLTEGRTDIAEGRSRFRKIYDKTAGKLPEELRYKAKQIRRGYETIKETIIPSGEEFETIEETTFERVKASEKATTELGRRLQLEALGVREKMVKAGKRLFAQEYTPVSQLEPVSFEMSDVGAMELRIPTDTQTLELRDIPLTPLEDIPARKLTKLSFAERISAPRVIDVATGGASAVGGIGIGFGVSQLLDQAKVNKYLNAVISGASADVGGRILNYGAERVALSAGLRTAETSALTAKTFLQGGLEGGAIGLASMPIDMLLNSSLRSAGLSHTASNMISSGVVGTGTTAGIMAVGGAGASETFGTSLVVAGLAVGALELIAFLTGQSADKQIEERNNVNEARNKFIDTLPNYDYDFIKALQGWKGASLGVNKGDWETWSKNAQSVFTGNPYDYKPPKSEDTSLSEEDRAKMGKYFQKYMIHELVKKVCSGKECSSDLINQDKGELDENEIRFLNDITDRTWQAQADMQVNYSMKEMEYTQQRVQKAKQEIINNWEKNGRLPEQLEDKNILKTANLDPNFKNAFDNAVKLDAQRQVVNAYMNNQTKIENLPENIQKMARLDKEFDYMIHVYYEDIEHQAGRMNISVPQLIELQGLPQDKQTNKYREFQFDYAKMSDKVVREAIDISKEEDKVREAGYYDIDQAYLETDPTAVGIWKPTDSQILQAHSAGMTLQMYVDYMHELAKGKVGDYTKLPGYSEKDIKQSGALDFSHFQDELQIAGFDPNMYSYNPETLAITLNTGVSNVPIPSTQNKFVSKYTPQNVLQMRQETADLIHGLDQQNQGVIDTYNTQLHKELTGYAENYDKMAARINEERNYQGINHLLNHYDVEGEYNKLRMEFKPVKVIPSAGRVLNADEATQKQMNVSSDTGTIPGDTRPQRDTSIKPGEYLTLDD